MVCLLAVALVQDFPIVAYRLKFEPLSMLPPVAFGAMALFYLHHARGFNDPTAAQAPLLYGRALLILSGLALVAAVMSALGGAPAKHDEETNPSRAVAILLILCAFVGAILAAGFYIAVPLFLLLFYVLVARMRWWVAAIGAAAGLFFVWAVFGRLLHMQVFGGMFF